MQEEEFVRRITQLFRPGPGVVEGIGDDCAVLEIPGAEKYMLAAVDQVVTNVHFLPETPVAAVAGKLVRRNVSDIAAMGGTPAYAMLSVALAEKDRETLMAFHEAIAAECAAYGMSVIGGDVSGIAGDASVYSLSIIGFVEKSHLRRRDTAKPGDSLWATGLFGRSFPTEHHLYFKPELEKGRLLSGVPAVHAMMDVSDGLLKDALRMASGSGLALRLEPESLPRRDGASVEEALGDGEDYCLIFAAAPEFTGKEFPGMELYRIGRFENGGAGVLLNQLHQKKKGFDHLEP